jgi:hypothetical protein
LSIEAFERHDRLDAEPARPDLDEEHSGAPESARTSAQWRNGVLRVSPPLDLADQRHPLDTPGEPT